jgi:hypothetical protein
MLSCSKTIQARDRFWDFTTHNFPLMFVQMLSLADEDDLYEIMLGAPLTIEIPWGDACIIFV